MVFIFVNDQYIDINVPPSTWIYSLGLSIDNKLYPMIGDVI
jgi:hypothetical protein